MQIVIRLEQKDFEGNKEVFDRMYGLCSVLNKRTEQAEMTKEEVEKAAHVKRVVDETEQTDTTPQDEKATAETTTDTYTIEEVRKAFGEYAKSQGRDKAKGLLQEMGYNKVTEIPPERYTEAMTRIGDVK